MRITYLCGQISTKHPETILWRKEASKMLIDPHGIIPLDPTSGFGMEDLEKITTDGGITSPALTNSDVVLRDYRDVKRSDNLLVNLNNYSSKRPFVGTPCELAWAWEDHKPVVAFVSQDKCDADHYYLVTAHPFISRFVSHYFDTMEEAVKFIALYY